MKYLVFGAALAVALSVRATAQDARFPGLHIEAVGGYDHGSAKFTYEDTAAPASNFQVEDDTDGVVYGFNVGYDLRLIPGNYLGIEAGYELSDNKRCEEVFGGDAACFSLKRNYHLGVRGGTRLSRRALAYAGIAYVNGKGRLSYSDPASPATDFAYSDNRDGFRLSVGIEERLVRNFFGKVEYRYSNYDDYTYTAGTQSASLGFDRNQVVVGIGARF